MQSPEHFQRNDHSQMSLREKALHRRRVNKEHNSNFRAGYVHISEEHLHKTGVRGRKAYIVYFVGALMLIIAIVNILLTLIVIGSLKIGKNGMQGLELLPPGLLTRFLVDSDMGDVYLAQKTLGTSAGQAMEVSAMNDNQVEFNVQNKSKVSVSSSTTTISSEDGFLVIDPDTANTVFTTDFEKLGRFPEKVHNLKIQQAVTNNVSSIDGDLKLKSDSTMTVRGSEGVKVEADSISINARHDVDLITSEELILSGKAIYLDKAKKMTYTAGADDEAQFKLCVCMPGGRLYAVPATYGCDEVNVDYDTCVGS